MTRSTQPSTEPSVTRTSYSPRRGNTTLDDPGVHVATSDDYNNAEAMIAALLEQETCDPLNNENCCAGGDHGFRTYKTDLPVIRSEDIVPGRLIYRPTTNPLQVYEITSEPYVNEHGSRRVDVVAHSRSHAGDNPDIRSREQTLFTASIVDEMTFIQPSTIQTTL